MVRSTRRILFTGGENSDLVGKLMEEDEELWGIPHQKWTDRKFLGI